MISRKKSCKRCLVYIGIISLIPIGHLSRSGFSCNRIGCIFKNLGGGSAQTNSLQAVIQLLKRSGTAQLLAQNSRLNGSYDFSFLTNGTYQIRFHHFAAIRNCIIQAKRLQGRYLYVVSECHPGNGCGVPNLLTGTMHFRVAFSSQIYAHGGIEVHLAKPMNIFVRLGTVVGPN